MRKPKELTDAEWSELKAQYAKFGGSRDDANARLMRHAQAMAHARSVTNILGPAIIYCSAKTKKGTQCSRQAVPGYALCLQHLQCAPR